MADYKIPVITGGALVEGDLLRWNGAAWVNYGDSAYQAQGDILDDLVALGPPESDSDGEFIVAAGYGTFVYESGATVRTSLGLGTSDSPTFAGLGLTGSVPALILKNSDNEHGQDEAESLIKFTDHTDAILAQIEGHHEGTADDTKGGLAISTHNGTDLVKAIWIDEAQYVGIGIEPKHPFQVYGVLKVGGSAGQTTGTISLGNDQTASNNVGIFRGTSAGVVGGGSVLVLAGYAGVAITAGTAGFGDQGAAILFAHYESKNIGINTITPDTKLQVVGDCKFGDDNTNYTSWSSTGVQTMTGTARVYDHFRIGAASFFKKDVPPESDLVGLYPVLKFDPDGMEQAYYTEPIPFRLAAGTTIQAVVHWCYEGGADVGSVVWGVEFINATTGEAVDGATALIYGVSAGDHTSGQMIGTTLIGGITGSVAEDCLGLRIFRVAGDSRDDLLVDACLIKIHLHFIIDKLGEPL